MIMKEKELIAAESLKLIERTIEQRCCQGFGTAIACLGRSGIIYFTHHLVAHNEHTEGRRRWSLVFALDIDVADRWRISV